MKYSLDSDGITVGTVHALGAGICAFAGGAILGSAHGMSTIIVPFFAAASGITAGLVSVAVYRWRRKGGCPHVAGLWSVGVSVLCYPLVLMWLLVLADGLSLGGRNPISEFVQMLAFGFIVSAWVVIPTGGGRNPISEFVQMLAFGFIVSAWVVIPTGYLCGYVSARMISARHRRSSLILSNDN